MKRKLKEELVKLSTDIITSRDMNEITDMYEAAKTLYEKLAVLKFIDEKLTDIEIDVSKNVIDYYRGGYDESTIGGNLLVTNSTFTNCGAKEENGILINTRGIINVDISKNEFQNNPVKLVALLWGAKNNSHSENQISNSGEIRVEENLKMKLMY